MAIKKLDDGRFWRFQCDTKEEWLSLKKNGIGGSSAASVIGCNPWKSNVELWEEKLGLSVPEDISDKKAVIYGSLAEEHLRNLFILDFPQFEIYHKEYELLMLKNKPFIYGSLDGEITVLEDCIFEGQALKAGMKGVLEIKTTEILNSMSRENWKNGVPQNYYCQVLHYLFVTNYDFAILKAQLKYDYKDSGKVRCSTQHYIFMKKDKIEDIKTLIQSEVNFWENFVTLKKKPPLILNMI